MSTKEDITCFKEQRPTATGVYGYGSGVFRQANERENNQPSIDIIFIVEDLKKWHIENMAVNPKDYSFLGQLHFSRASITRVKGKNKITYLSNIKEGDRTFKYGVIESNDFLTSLETWENIFVAGRFQKPVLSISTNNTIQDAISYNRKCALIIACILSDRLTNIYSLYNILCGLSYSGDARMRFAENPHKVENIVKGNYQELLKVYPLQEDYIEVQPDGRVEIDHQQLLTHITELPFYLLEFLIALKTDFNDIDMLRINIDLFFKQKNRTESISQIKEGIQSNGVINSVPYILAKLKKHFY